MAEAGVEGEGEDEGRDEEQDEEQDEGEGEEDRASDLSDTMRYRTDIYLSYWWIESEHQ